MYSPRESVRAVKQYKPLPFGRGFLYLYNFTTQISRSERIRAETQPDSVSVGLIAYFDHNKGLES